MSNFFKKFAIGSVLSTAPAFAAAADIGEVIDSFTDVLLSIIPVLMALAVLVFFWGIVKFIAHAGDEKAVEEGKQLMIWGMVGLFVMVGFWGIVGYLQEAIGLDDATPLGDLQTQPGCIYDPSSGTCT